MGIQSTYEYFFTNQGFASAQAYPASMWQKTGELLPFLAPWPTDEAS
ncbi:hypothetical protein JYJ95_34970 [Corallococcus exiguus]|nr:hypothetical protein [Corallococcus exiguus]MBN8471739.1 hypothetical protein [Corallococcus exiguus]